MVISRTVTVTEFKAKCLAFFDEVETGNVSITVTRRGKVVGVLNPPPKRKPATSRDRWAGKIRVVGDIVNADTSSLWDIVNGREWDPGK